MNHFARSSRDGARDSRDSRLQQGWDLDDRMTVVLFAGMGGGCDGLEDAGFHVHLAVNHDPLAIAVHEARHPHTTHLRCDVFEVDPRKATRGRGVRNLHASPDCTHFSVAKGSKPVSRRRRSLAWVVPRWMGTVRPDVVTLENVREIATWGPLICKRDPATGRCLKLDKTVAAKGERVPIEQQWLIPDPRHKGRIWRAWLKHVRGLGYNFEFRTLCCADYGVPTIRTRFFGVGRADGGPIVWPERTHAPRSKCKALGLKPWVGADTIIDWSRPTTSIFERKKPLADATLRRIAAGIVRYVLEASDPFIVPITHHGAGARVHDIAEPLRTLTTAHRGEMAVIAPVTVGAGGRAAQTDPRSVAEPLSTSSTKEDRILVEPVAAHLEKFSENSVGLDPRDPLTTVMAGGQGHAVVAAHLTKFRNGAVGAEATGPLPAYTANSFHKRPGGSAPIGVVAATMVGLAHGHSGSRREYDLREPTLTKHAGGKNEALVAATLVQTGYGEREGQAPRALDIEEPAGTQVAGGSKAALVAALLTKHFGGVVGADLRDPIPTLTTGGERGVTQQAVTVAALGRLRGNDVDGQDLRHPLPTQTSGAGHEMLILPFLQTYYGSGVNAHDARDPLHTVTVGDRHGLVAVEVNGQTMIITDIRMRMLHWSEGARAHGFDPASLEHDIEVTDAKGRVKRRKPNATECMALIGNSVPPWMVTILAERNSRRELLVAAE